MLAFLDMSPSRRTEIAPAPKLPTASKRVCLASSQVCLKRPGCNRFFLTTDGCRIVRKHFKLSHVCVLSFDDPCLKSRALDIDTTRPMLGPDMQTVQDALERFINATQHQGASDIDKSLAEDWDLNSYLPSEGRPPIVCTQQQQQQLQLHLQLPDSAKAAALPKNAAVIELDAVVSPNLVSFFLIVFLSLGIYLFRCLLPSILSAPPGHVGFRKAPFGLETKMSGSVIFGDEEDQ